MKAVPRRLLVLGGGPVGVEMAQAVRRLGGEVALVERGRACARRASRAPLGEALGEVLRRDGVELVLGVQRDGGPARRRRTSSSTSTTAASCAATGCSSRPVAGRGSTASGSRPSASPPTARHPGRRAPAGRPSGCGRSATSPASGRSPTSGSTRATSSRRTSSASRARRNYDAVPRVVFTDPQAAAVGATEARFSGTAPLAEIAEDRDLHPRVRRVERLPDPAQRRRAADRRVRARPGGRRVAPAGDAGDPRARPARRAARHDPAVPDVLGDLRRRAEGAPREIAERREPVGEHAS